MRKSFARCAFAVMAALVGCDGAGDADEQYAFVKETDRLVEVDPATMDAQPSSSVPMSVTSDGESLTFERGAAPADGERVADAAADQDSAVCEGWCTSTRCYCKGDWSCCQWACAQCVDL